MHQIEQAQTAKSNEGLAKPNNDYGRNHIRPFELTVQI